MSVTMQHLLKLPILQENCQILNDADMNNIVQYVTVVEAANIHFPSFEEDLFVLTTLSSYCDSLEKINNFIRGLCEVKVSAIGIKLGRFIDEIDPSTILIAKEHNVVLLAISPNVYFRAILSDALSVITGNQRQTLNKINRVNQALIESILQNCSIQNLLDILCAELECYCCCLVPDKKKIAESSSLPDPFDTQQVYAAIDSFFLQHSASNEAYFHAGNTFIFPCTVQENLSAAFCIVVFEPVLDVVIPLVQAIVSGICIKFLEQNLEVQAKRGIISATLDDILLTHSSSHEMAAERLEFLNFKPRNNFMIILLSRPVTAQKRSWFFTVDSIQRVFAARFPSAISFKRGSEYILLISYDASSVTQRLEPILELCHSTLLTTEGEAFDMGCSTITTDLSQMPECYLQAKKAVQFGRTLDPKQHVYLYNKYFELGLISCGIGSSEADIFLERIINPILEYDKQFKTDLWATLEVCFANESLQNIAAALHIHISTLRYRLQKIENLTGYSFFNSHNRLTLYLAFLLYKVSSDGDF